MRIAASFLLIALIAALLLGIRMFMTLGRDGHGDERADEALGSRWMKTNGADSETRWSSRAPKTSERPTGEDSIEFRFDEEATTTPELMSEFLSSGPITVRRMFELMEPPRGASDAGFGDMSFIYLSSDQAGLFVSVSSGSQSPVGDSDEVFLDYEIVSIQSIRDDLIETIWRRDPHEETIFSEDSSGELGSEDWGEDPFALKEEVEAGGGRPAMRSQSKSEGRSR